MMMKKRAPLYVDQDDDGLVVLLTETPSDEFIAVARKAATLCPAKAIALEE